MQTAKNQNWAPPAPQESASRATDPERRAEAALTSILRAVGAADGHEAPPVAGSPASALEWAGLIDRVRMAAGRAREVEAQAQEQDLRVQELLERVRADLAAADERVRIAEARVQTIQNQAEARIRAAETRAASAEARACTAEDWLARIEETIATEFADCPESRG